MADGDFVGIDVQGVEEVRAILRAIPPEVQAAVVQDVSGYLVNALRQYPTQKYVSRAEAYPDAPAGPGWFSDKQRRWFFSHLGEMQIPYRRTQQMARNWRVEGQGARAIIVNETSYAVHMQGDDTQSRMAAKGGWRKLAAIIQERMGRIIEVANAAARKAIKRLDKTAP